MQSDPTEEEKLAWLELNMPHPAAGGADEWSFLPEDTADGWAALGTVGKAHWVAKQNASDCAPQGGGGADAEVQVRAALELARELRGGRAISFFFDREGCEPQGVVLATLTARLVESARLLVGATHFVIGGKLRAHAPARDILIPVNRAGEYPAEV